MRILEYLDQGVINSDNAITMKVKDNCCIAVNIMSIEALRHGKTNIITLL